MFDTPTIAQLRETADELGMSPTDDYLEATRRIISPLVDAYRTLDGVTDDLPEVLYPRTPGYRPGPEENPHGAWYVKTAITGAKRGKLAGRRIAMRTDQPGHHRMSALRRVTSACPPGADTPGTIPDFRL